MFDVKGRFTVHRISAEEASYKLCKVKRVQLGNKGVPFIVTHDGRTIRYPDPIIKVNDTVKFDLQQNKIVDTLPFEVGSLVMCTGGRNQGRVGTILSREKHSECQSSVFITFTQLKTILFFSVGGYDIVHVRDVLDRAFSTRIGNVQVIGTHGKPSVSLPRGGGVKLTIAEDRDQRRKQKEKEGH
jgi:small subunit ribosomal protein S4e